MEKKSDLHGSGNDFSRQKGYQRQKFNWKQGGKVGTGRKPCTEGKEVGSKAMEVGRVYSG